MEPKLSEQIMNLIDKSQNILLLTHARADADGLGAMISMYMALKELGKDVTAVTSDPAPESLQFLPSIDIVQNSLASSNDFVITLNTSQVEAEKIKYNVSDNRVNIIISPKGEGTFSESDVSFGGSGAQYDLIMVFDTGNLEHLGSIYDRNSEMFFDVPVINVDHHASNTDYGKINLVDVVSSSTTEVVYSLLKDMSAKYNKTFINEDMATLLLAGIITDTGSFQHANTSPKSMETAAELLDLGARQQEIIKNIYKTKKLSTLKLWGIVLSKVQVDPVYRMVWSTISAQDLREAGATSEETGDIIDSLLSNAPGAEVIFLIKENPEAGYTSVSMRSTSNAIDVGKLCQGLGGGGHVRAAGAKIKDQAFDQAVATITEAVRKFQADRLNIHDDEQSNNQPAQQELRGQPPQPDKPKQEPQEQKQQNQEQPQEQPKETMLEFKAPKQQESEKPKTTQEQPAKQEKPPQKPQKEQEPQPQPKQEQQPPKQPQQQNQQEEPKQQPAPEKPAEPAPQPQQEGGPVKQDKQDPKQQNQEQAKQDTPQSQETPKDVPDWLKPE